MSGPEVGPAIAVARVVIDRAAPAGLKLVRSWIHGKTIVVAGPARSGKTTFMNYLQYGVFEHAQETAVTYRASPSKRFNFTVGPHKNLEVNCCGSSWPGPRLVRVGICTSPSRAGNANGRVSPATHLASPEVESI
jgi:hypothetical protein